MALRKRHNSCGSIRINSRSNKQVGHDACTNDMYVVLDSKYTIPGRSAGSKKSRSHTAAGTCIIGQSMPNTTSHSNNTAHIYGCVAHTRDDICGRQGCGTAGAASTTTSKYISYVGSVRTASTRGTEILSMCPVYLTYTSTVCAPCRRFSEPLLGTKHAQMVPRVGVGANYFSWGQLEYLEHY